MEPIKLTEDIFVYEGMTFDLGIECVIVSINEANQMIYYDDVEGHSYMASFEDFISVLNERIQ